MLDPIQEASGKTGIISFGTNPVRWCFYYFLVGMVIGCLCAFIEETLFPLPFPNFMKVLAVTIVCPVITIVCSVRLYKAGVLQ